MNKDAYLILTEIKWVFLVCIDSLEMQRFWIGRKKQKAKLCRRKGKQAPKIVLSGKTRKNQPNSPHCGFKHLLNAKQVLQGEKRRKHVFHEREKRLKILYKTKMLIFLISHLHLGRSQQGPIGRQSLVVPGTALALVQAHLDWVSLQNLVCWSLPESLIWGVPLSATV